MGLTLDEARSLEKLADAATRISQTLTLPKAAAFLSVAQMPWCGESRWSVVEVKPPTSLKVCIKADVEYSGIVSIWVDGDTVSFVANGFEMHFHVSAVESIWWKLDTPMPESEEGE